MSTNPHFLVQISASGVGGLPREGGGGAKSSARPSKHSETKLLIWEIPGFLPGYPGEPEKFEKKEFVFNFWPLHLFIP